MATLANYSSNGIDYKSLTMVDDLGKPVTRGLYLYGFVNEREVKKHGAVEGYDLPKPVGAILQYLFTSLKKSKQSLLNSECLQKQEELFNLKDAVPWIKKQSQPKETGFIYVAEPCTGQAQE